MTGHLLSNLLLRVKPQPLPCQDIPRTTPNPVLPQATARALLVQVRVQMVTPEIASIAVLLPDEASHWDVVALIIRFAGSTETSL